MPFIGFVYALDCLSVYVLPSCSTNPIVSFSLSTSFFAPSCHCIFLKAIAPFFSPRVINHWMGGGPHLGVPSPRAGCFQVITRYPCSVFFSPLGRCPAPPWFHWDPPYCAVFSGAIAPHVFHLLFSIWCGAPPMAPDLCFSLFAMFLPIGPVESLSVFSVSF